MAQRFAANPVKTTFSGFAKLTKLLSENLVMQDPGRTMAPDFADELLMSIDESEESTLNTVTSSQPTDPDFCFIDEKVMITYSFLLSITCGPVHAEQLQYGDLCTTLHALLFVSESLKVKKESKA